jgi:5-methylcytosine-specific restriction protein A
LSSGSLAIVVGREQSAPLTARCLLLLLGVPNDMPTRNAVHRPPWWKPRAVAERERKDRLDGSRPGAAARGYDQAWRTLRRQFLAANPRCCVAGCLAPATEVDHIITVRRRPDLRLVWDNLRSCCKPHHSQHTALAQGFARPG